MKILYENVVKVVFMEAGMNYDTGCIVDNSVIHR